MKLKLVIHPTKEDAANCSKIVNIEYNPHLDYIMSKVTQDIIPGAIPVEEGSSPPKDDEEAAVAGSSSKDAQTSPPNDKTRRNFIGVLLGLVALALIIGLSVGLTQNNDQTPTTQQTPSYVEIFDMAVALVKSTERQSKLLTSGEKMSYREYNVGQPHVLVLLPGFLHNDVMFAVSTCVLCPWLEHAA